MAVGGRCVTVKKNISCFVAVEQQRAFLFQSCKRLCVCNVVERNNTLLEEGVAVHGVLAKRVQIALRHTAVVSSVLVRLHDNDIALHPLLAGP